MSSVTVELAVAKRLAMLKEREPMRDDPHVTDLVTRARKGDQQAWDALVERYAPNASGFKAKRMRAASDVGCTV